jgi:hypothetical protein
MLSVIKPRHYAVSHYADCHCHYAENLYYDCHFAKSHYDESHYVE